MTPQELKNSVLQRAIQGKLVEQRPEEGTGEELYRRIQAEKRRLIKSGELKKGKPLPEITEDEIPFDIPDSWKWVRLGSVFSVIMGQSPDGNKVTENGNGLEFHQGKIYFSETVVKKSPQTTDSPTKIAPANSLLLCVRAPVGKVNITDRTLCIGRGLSAIVCHCDMSTMFAFYWLAPLENTFIKKATGTTFKAISANTINEQLVPLPPLAEQRRIVAKIEELFPYIDRYAAAWERLETFNGRFPSDMRKSLLQTALQGKLVEQRPDEGTGDELYRMIQAEKRRLIQSGKLKKEKPLPEITEDESPFDIPDNWKWLWLGNIITLLSGTDFKPEEYNAEGKGTPYITGASNFTQESLIVNRWTDKPKVIANYGDILLVCKGSGYGKTIVCNLTEAHIARQIMAVKRNNLLDMRYIRYFLSANFNLLKSRGQGVIPGIERKAVLELAFPLPPLAEQRRIVARLEELLPLCNGLQ